MHSQNYLDTQLKDHITAGIDALALERPKDQVDFLSQYFEHRADVLDRSNERIDEVHAMRHVDQELRRAIGIEGIRALPERIRCQHFASPEDLLRFMSCIIVSGFPNCLVATSVPEAAATSEELENRLKLRFEVFGQSVPNMSEVACELVADGFRYADIQSFENADLDGPGPDLYPLGQSFVIKLDHHTKTENGPIRTLCLITITAFKNGAASLNEDVKQMLIQTMKKVSDVLSATA